MVILFGDHFGISKKNLGQSNGPKLAQSHWGPWPAQVQLKALQISLDVHPHLVVSNLAYRGLVHQPCMVHCHGYQGTNPNCTSRQKSTTQLLLLQCYCIHLMSFGNPAGSAPLTTHKRMPRIDTQQHEFKQQVTSR